MSLFTWPRHSATGHGDDDVDDNDDGQGDANGSSGILPPHFTRQISTRLKEIKKN